MPQDRASIETMVARWVGLIEQMRRPCANHGADFETLMLARAEAGEGCDLSPDAQAAGGRFLGSMEGVVERVGASLDDSVIASSRICGFSATRAMLMLAFYRAGASPFDAVALAEAVMR